MNKVIIAIAVIVVLLAGAALAAMNYIGDKILTEAMETGFLDEVTGESAAPYDTAIKKEETNNAGKSSEAVSQGGSVQAGIKGSAGQGKKVVISVQKVKEIKNKITIGDKLTAATMIMRKLSSGDIAALKELAQGGMTKEKKEQAKKIAYERFTPDEIMKIKELYHKYVK